MRHDPDRRTATVRRLRVSVGCASARRNPSAADLAELERLPAAGLALASRLASAPRDTTPAVPTPGAAP